jgi:hypothetical protein
MLEQKSVKLLTAILNSWNLLLKMNASFSNQEKKPFLMVSADALK